MLSQIALYQQVPKIREALHGFIHETTGHLVDLDSPDDGTTPGKKLSLKLKYNLRLKRAQEMLITLAKLDRCLNE